MSRARVNFQVQSAYVGPLATGFHFVLGDGTFTNNWNSYNLIQQLDRVHNASYEISTNPAALKQMGTKGLLSRPLIEPPNINLNFSYYLNGIKNEARLGFDVNYAQFQGGHRGDPYYSSRVCPISGFSSRELVRIRNSPFCTYTCKDFRNLFFVVGPEGQDIRETASTSIANQSNTGFRLLDTKSTNYEIIAFGNCYINNYSLNVAVGEFPSATVSYICENVSYQKNALGSGIIPALNKQNCTKTDKLFSIPKSAFEGGPTILRPGDITLTISGGDLYDVGLNFTDAKCQSFSLDLPIPRENLNALGWMLPVDRPITPPIYSTIKTELIMGDGSFSGDVANLFTGSLPYNLTVKMLGRTGCISDPINSYQIDVLGALFRSIGYSSSLESNKTCSLVFDVEVDCDNLTQGLFLSGCHNIINPNSLPLF